MGSLFKPRTETVVSKTDLPDWAKELFLDEAGRSEEIYDLARGEYQDLADPREILDPYGLEREGYEDILSGIEGARGYLDRAGEGLMLGAEDRYLEDVVDTTLGEMDVMRERQRMANELAASRVGGTTNTRRAVQEAVADNEFARQRAGVESGLRSDALRWGTDTDFRTRQQMQDLGRWGTDLANLEGATKGSFGELERGLDQLRLDEERTAGTQAIDWLSGVYRGTQTDKPSRIGETSNQQKRPSIFQSLLGAATSLGGAWLASDERVKENIEMLGEDYDALQALDDIELAAFNYQEGEGHREDDTLGVMAQDVQMSIPEAVASDAEGRLHIDPSVMTAVIIRAVQQLNDRTAALSPETEAPPQKDLADVQTV